MAGRRLHMNYDQFNHAQERGHEKNNPKCKTCHRDASYPTPPAESYAPLTVNEIINGEQDTPLLSSSARFPGLMTFVRAYLRYSKASTEQQMKLEPYLVSGRASGEYATPSSWMRSLVRGHGGYKGDIVVNGEVCYGFFNRDFGVE